MTYLDNAATTFPKPPEVTKAINDCMENYAVNAGRGIYPLARQADQMISETRSLVCSLIGFPLGKAIFTSSATIALNQVIQGIDWQSGDVVYTTPFEHNSVMRPLHFLSQQYNLDIMHLPVDRKELYYDIDK